MKTKQAVNPYMPSWEYVPDAEPHVVGDRVYVYGSHDIFNGLNFCLGDYVCWSAPIDDLGNWRYEGCIYKREQDPAAPRIRLTNGLAAPDMVQGPDGRFYLYYFMGGTKMISVAVCDEPAGKYEFYGYVRTGHQPHARRVCVLEPRFVGSLCTSRFTAAFLHDIVEYRQFVIHLFFVCVTD